MNKRLSPEKMKRRRLAYMRALLQHDVHPADPYVLDQFERLGWLKREPEAQREVWDHLLHYLVTLERQP
jgi:hypothetical protein